MRDVSDGVLELRGECDLSILEIIARDSHGVATPAYRIVALPLSCISDGDFRQDEEVIDHTQVAAMMTRDPITVSADAPLQEAVGLMRQYRVSALPVLDNDELVGIISTVDLLDALVSLLDKRGA